MTLFTLHPQLATDTESVVELNLCKILLMNDQTYPWVVMVPKRLDLREIHDLSPADQQLLVSEITQTSKAMQRLFKADKMNVAALGNMVPQLHIHVIARYENDSAWPGPIWGMVPAAAYAPNELAAVIDKLKEALS